MNPILTIIIFSILACTISFGQKWNQELICSADTLVYDPQLSYKHYPDGVERLNYPYKYEACRTRSNFAFRIEIAVSDYYYGEKTTSWIGQHGGPNVNFILDISKLNFGFRFKPWTIHPKKELSFDGQTLTTNAIFNVVKLDYYLGYSFDFNALVSLEPYIGYNRTLFIVLNEDELHQKYYIHTARGLIIGTTLNKYFKVKNYGYISVFGSLGYGCVNFEKVHPDLDNGYFEWTMGVAYKGFASKYISRRIE